MRTLGRVTITFGIIIFALGLVGYFLYHNLGFNRYEFHGKNAPIPTELHPIVEEKAKLLVEQAKQQGITIIITESIRSFDRQNELYAQGRTKEGNIVTYAQAGESYHNYGLAIDFAIMDSDGNLTWDMQYDGNNNTIPDWDEVVAIAKELGFEWGGDWTRFKDYPHLQMTFGLSIQQLKLGFRPKNEMPTE
ncbi:M15 family metallopeptidase [Ornithinibacillus sp. FSL M8-0202]|uniref:M15 family metallopeptidase n=1 Tax=unclassified Ornithinibacillus TaxID=2620869 RepID=UPI0030CC41C6